MNKLEEKIVELIKENQPIKQKALSDKLFEKYGYDLSTRQIREHILDINNYFIKDKTDFIVAGDNNGMFVTKKKEIIRRFNNNKKKQAYSLLKNAFRTDKKLNEQMNISLDEYIAEEMRKELQNEPMCI